MALKIARSRRYVLGLLTAIYTLNFIDRNLVILLLEPIKIDLRLSDTQLGFLTGIAFGLFYAVLGIPIARLADRGDRVTIASVAIGLWGLTVMSCLLVVSFGQLITARIAAAVGDAGCMPSTYSLLGDYFSKPAERAQAMAIYWLANPMSALISFAIGGWLSEIYGWRLTFFILGIPGLIAAVLLKLTVTDPRRLSDYVSSEPIPSLGGVVTMLWDRPASRNLSIAIILFFILGLGLAPWFAAFMIRSYAIGTGELGLWFAVIWGFGGIAGVLLSGYASKRWALRDRTQLRICAVMAASLLPSYAAFLLAPTKLMSFAAMVPLVVATNYVLGPSFALLQRLVADNQRATALAIVMLAANLVGMGLAPQGVGAMSDLLRAVVAGESLRYAMLSMALVSLWTAYHFLRASQAIEADPMLNRPPAPLSSRRTDDHPPGEAV